MQVSHGTRRYRMVHWPSCLQEGKNDKESRRGCSTPVRGIMLCEVVAMMSELDTNRDGFVDLGEFVAFHGCACRDAEQEAELRITFDVYTSTETGTSRRPSSERSGWKDVDSSPLTIPSPGRHDVV
uniref:EF-hand domain-containing protein n=1 Tax=Oryza brachyantha TaxID=4533 RepID=J3LQA1_ORYBR